MCKDKLLHIEDEAKEYVNIQTGEVLDLYRVSPLPDNAILKVKPKLWCEWNFEKNDELGYDIWKLTKGSEKRVYWVCMVCGSDFESKLYSRIVSNCPYCAGQKVNRTNSLATLNTQLAKEWHPTKNGELTPDDVTSNSSKRVWWLGECGHEWNTQVSDRSNGKNCPYCSNKKVLKGFNDMWTTNPDLANLLANPEDGYKYTAGSSKKVDWRCECRNLIKDKPINKIRKDGISCPKCSDGISYPEKFILFLLKEIGISFIHDSTFQWSDNKRYDFYIPSLNMIIETHGRQHYDENCTFQFRDLEYEIGNDIFKRELAKNNGIDRYVELNCSESNQKHIVNSIYNSEIVNLLNITNIDFNKIHKSCLKSTIFSVCKYFTENRNIEQKTLSKIFNVSDKTIREYLKIGNEIGICNYTPNDTETKMTSVNHMRVKVVQLDTSGTFIKSHSSVKEAGEYLNKKHYSSISACCKGKSSSAYGFKWMYLKDYEKMINNQNKIS